MIEHVLSVANRPEKPIIQDSNKIVSEALSMIDLCSASKNGNKVPEDAKSRPELLWVRYCDRLEAIGTIGAVRAY